MLWHQSSRPGWRLLGAVLAGALSGSLAAGCAATVDVGGHLVDPDAVKEIKPGTTDRRKVVDILGTPSAKATFDDDTWYYVGDRTETVAFLTPKLLERKILVVRFDAAGTVAQLSQLDASQGREIALIDRVTPTKGKELGLLEQFLGNLGRFSTNEGAEGLGPRNPVP